MGDMSTEKKSGCGLCNAFFYKKAFWPRKLASPAPIQQNDGDMSTSDPRNQVQHPVQRPNVEATNPPRNIVQCYGNQNFVYVNRGKRVPKDAIGISGELESMFNEREKSRGNAVFVRASSSNVMLFGNLGNLRQPEGGNTISYGSVDKTPVNVREEKATSNNAARNVSERYDEEKPRVEQAGSLCRAISVRMDPEQLKVMGNEDFKNGNYVEALALYDAAIAIDPNRAAFRSNKSAALTALGRLLEAVFECREAIRIEPHYHRAHHRLSRLYLRLGEVEKSIYHNKHAGPEADHDNITKAKTVRAHLNKCTEACRMRDWNALVKETEAAISVGADSAPQIYSLQAEALLKLRRHQEADEAMAKCSNFNIDDCTKFLGPIGSANMLVVRAQVDMAVGRFDDALNKAQRATRLDPNSKDANNVMRKAKEVAAARAKGNKLFKEGRYNDACQAYGEGLEREAYNSVLLCNRAACLSKLGHYEKALEDCSLALNLRANYTKARLRRADCYSKLENWEASVQDYETLQKEAPDDEQVLQGFLEAKKKLNK